MKNIIRIVLLIVCCSVQANIPAWTNDSATASQSKNDAESHTLTHANSKISAGNLNSDSQSFTLAGANVEITHDINLNTQHPTPNG